MKKSQALSKIVLLHENAHTKLACYVDIQLMKESQLSREWFVLVCHHMKLPSF